MMILHTRFQDTRSFRRFLQLTPVIGLLLGGDLPPRTSPPSKLDSEPFEVHSTG